MVQLVEYLTAEGGSPFRKWHDGLDVIAAAKVYVALTRLEAGNISNVTSVGDGVLEQKIDFGPGYRVYFGRDGNKLVILLAGGTKQRQQRDVATAIARWQDYKLRRKRGRNAPDA